MSVTQHGRLLTSHRLALCYTLLPGMAMNNNALHTSTPSISNSNRAVPGTPCLTGKPGLFLGGSIFVTLIDNVWCISFLSFFKGN